MTTKYEVKLSGEDEQLVEHVRADAMIGNKEHFTKLALLMFADIYLKKQAQMEEEASEANNRANTQEDSEGTEEE
jgi:hypothetical protein